MKTIEQMSVGKRVWLPFATLGAMLLIIGGWFYFSLRAIERSNQLEQARALKKLAVIDDIGQDVGQMQAMVVREVLAADVNEVKLLDHAVFSLEETNAAEFQSFQQYLDDAEERQLYDAVARAQKLYWEKTQLVMALSRANQDSEATKLINATQAPGYDQYLEAINKLIAHLEGDANDSAAATTALIAKIRIIGDILVALAALAALGTFFAVAGVVRRFKEDNRHLQNEVAERKRTEEQLRVQSTALDAAANAIVITDHNGAIQSVNPAFTALTGYTALEAVGQNPRLLNSGQQDEAFYRNLWQTISSGQVWSGQLTNRRKDGSLYAEEMTITPLRDGDGVIARYIAIKQDITARKQAEMEIQHQAAFPRFNPNPVLELSATGEISYFNHASEVMARKLGLETAEQMLPPNTAEMVRACLDAGTPKLRVETQIGSRVISWSFFPIKLNNTVHCYAGDITERKRAEEALRRSETKFRMLYDSTGDAVMLLDEKGFFDCNRAALAIFGCATREEFCSKTPANLSPPMQPDGANSLTLANRQIAVAMEKGSHRFEWMHRRADTGEPFPAEVLLSAMQLDGKPVLQATVRDITERKRADETLRASQQIIEGIINAIPARVFWKDKNLVYLGCNTVFARDAGFADPKDIIGKNDYQMGWRDQAEKYRADDRQVIESGLSKLLMEEPQTTPTGDIITLLSSKIPLCGSTGEISGMLGTYLDITARKQTEVALQERARLAVLEAQVGTALTRGGTLAEMLRLCSEAIVRQLDVAFARVWTFNAPENMLELQASAGMYTHLNGPHGRVPIGTLKIGLIAEERKPHLTNQVVGDPRVGDQEWAKREGMIAFAGYPLVVEDRLVGVVALFARHPLTDTTLEALASISKNIAVGIDHKRAAEELRASEKKFKDLFESSRDAIMTFEPPSWKFTSGNPAAVKIFGAKNEEDFISHSPWELSPDRQPDGRTSAEKAKEMIATAMREGSHFFEWTHRRIGGEEFPATVLITRMQSAEKLFYQATIRDTSESKRFEAKLFQSQKMETVGKLAGGIAHEFNSIMTAIIGQSELMLYDLPAGNPLRKNATEIHQAADRAAVLTRQLLAYGRKQILQPDVLDLDAILAGMENTLHHLAGRDVDVLIAPSSGPKLVKADPGQIEQVIVNIVMNAADAMPRGGKLTLETAETFLDQEYVRQFHDLKTGDYVMLAITDTGAGMSEAVKARLFEPFFTTKDVGKGSGLGLATCHGIIKQSGGQINVYSELGRGATFKIYLPKARLEEKPAGPPLQSPGLPRGTETILLVEDDPALREMAAALLGRLGYTVLTAGNGLEALNVTHQRATGHIDLLFTDVVMPHMSGKELSDRIQALYPRTKILFTSAYTETAIVHQGVLNPGITLLQKPFTPSALAGKVREVLDSDKPAAPL